MQIVESCSNLKDMPEGFNPSNENQKYLELRKAAKSFAYYDTPNPLLITPLIQRF